MTMHSGQIEPGTRRRERSGFTVFEVLMAAVLLSIGLMALAAMQVLGIRGNVDGEDRSMAATLVSARLNEFMAVPYVQNSETGSPEWDPSLEATGGWIAPRMVNVLGLTRDEMELAYPSADLSQEQFRYELTWMVEDVGDQTMPGAWKRVSIRVTWTDRSVQAAGEVGRIEIDSVPLAPQYL